MMLPADRAHHEDDLALGFQAHAPQAERGALTPAAAVTPEGRRDAAFTQTM